MILTYVDILNLKVVNNPFNKKFRIRVDYVVFYKAKFINKRVYIPEGYSDDRSIFAYSRTPVINGIISTAIEKQIQSMDWTYLNINQNLALHRTIITLSNFEERFKFKFVVNKPS